MMLLIAAKQVFRSNGVACVSGSSGEQHIRRRDRRCVEGLVDVRDRRAGRRGPAQLGHSERGVAPVPRGPPPVARRRAARRARVRARTPAGRLPRRPCAPLIDSLHIKRDDRQITQESAEDRSGRIEFDIQSFELQCLNHQPPL